MPHELNEATQKLIRGVLAGDRLQLARAITQVENETPVARPLLQAIYSHSGRAHIVGVTGAPGTGKSTLVTELTRAYRQAGQTVAVVAVDPTSPFTGGALLGDRVRMRTLSGDTGVFVRSMATRGNLGGLSKTTRDVVTLLDAAGFERILVETVGVGQAEVEIASMAHTTVVVEAPGLGDEIQAIKAGVLEIADILVVNKADRPGADATLRALQLALGRDTQQAVRHHGQSITASDSALALAPSSGWRVEILKTIATNGDGIEPLRQQIEAHADWLHESGQYCRREQENVTRHLVNILHTEIGRRLQGNLTADGLQVFAQQIGRRETDPYSAADLLIKSLFPQDL
ncbi:MAG: methylmalonyl Co-A mutase-associated GTPase MeaB [Caldilineaceae bacterium]